MTFQPAEFDEFELLTMPDNQVAAYTLAPRGFALFPIVDWKDGDGPKPIKDFNGRATTDLATIADWFTRYPDAQLGLAAGEISGVTVLDIDVKKGKDGIASMKALGFSDFAALSPVRVSTPSGGWHLYFQHEPRLKNSASRIGPGIDVKTTGGFVMAPGSRKSSGVYRIEGAALGSVPLPPFPEALIPPAEPEMDVPPVTGHVTDEQREWAAAYLKSLADDLGGMTEGGRNAALNDAAMWAGGAAARGFIDIEVAKADLWAAAETAGLRIREFRATFRSGWKAGLKKPISGFPRVLDLDALEDLDASTDDDFSALLQTAAAGDDIFVDRVTRRLNLRHAIVAVRGKTLATTEHKDGTIDFGQVRDLHTLYANDLVPAGKDTKGKLKMEAASARWLRDPDRRTYDGVTFAPGKDEPGVLNLWRGWAVEPDPTGSCELFLAHVRTVVCRGNPDHAAYVLGWLAHMVQHPELKPGVALVLRGAKGAGKDTLAEYVAKMIGRRHAPTVAHTDHIVGKFNARLENALLLHVQEGSWAGDPKAEGVLKYLVTSDRVEIERKGIDSINLPSVLRLFISANADWVVPASPDERRWAVFEVSDARRGDESYFTALRAEMNGSGPAALLHFLRMYDLSAFNVRKAPETAGLLEQKLATLKNVDLWWLELLNHGVLPSTFFDGAEAWTDAGQTISKESLRRNYAEWMKGRRYDGETVNERHFGRRLRLMLPELEERRTGSRSDRTRQYGLPPLGMCRAAFDRWLDGPVDWDDGSNSSSTFTA